MVAVEKKGKQEKTKSQWTLQEHAAVNQNLSGYFLSPKTPTSPTESQASDQVFYAHAFVSNENYLRLSRDSKLPH